MEFDRDEKALVHKFDDEGNMVYEFDSAGANRALELLGKHLKLFTDNIHHTGGLTLEDFVSESQKKDKPNG